MTDRGPDNAGFAAHGQGRPGHVKLTMRGSDLEGIAAALGSDINGAVRDTHLLLSVPDVEEPRVRGCGE